jgi:hypothetical protein
MTLARLPDRDLANVNGATSTSRFCTTTRAGAVLVQDCKAFAAAQSMESEAESA